MDEDLFGVKCFRYWCLLSHLKLTQETFHFVSPFTNSILRHRHIWHQPFWLDMIRCIQQNFHLFRSFPFDTSYFEKYNKWMLNTTNKLNSHNQQNHHLISYMFSLSISFLHENYLDVREDSFLHICGHTWQMYSLRHVVYILGKYFALYPFFNTSFVP